MEISDIDPEDLQKYLAGIDWPANKETVVESAKGNGAPEAMLEEMRNCLSGRIFSVPEEVADNLRH